VSISSLVSSRSFVALALIAARSSRSSSVTVVIITSLHLASERIAGAGHTGSPLPLPLWNGCVQIGHFVMAITAARHHFE
jgi:hypothetical protein